jgi:hypothetical protein
MGKALRSSLASFLSFTGLAGPLGSADLSKLKVPDGQAPPDIPSRSIPNAKAAPPAHPNNNPWIESLKTFAELRSPYPSSDPLLALAPPPILPIFSSSSIPKEEEPSKVPSSGVSTQQLSPRLTKRTARIELKNIIENRLIDPDTAKTILQDLKVNKVSPAKIVEMANAIRKFYRGEVGKTLSKFEIQAATWLGYVAGNIGPMGDSPVRGPEGVIGYLRGMDERIEELRKGNDVVIDPRGRKGFREYYLSMGAPAVLRLKKDGLVDSVPHSVQLILSLPSQPWTERIRKLVETDPGQCVTAVILTLAENKIPNPFSTILEEGNNPAGLAAQLLNQFGYKSVNPLDGKDRPLKFKTNYGEVNVTMLTPKEFIKAAYSKKIPSYSLVFQTRHPSWTTPPNGSEAPRPATSPDSRGFDAAVAIPSFDKNAPFALWNGRRNGLLIYGEATQWVFVLTPHDHGLKHSDPIQELLIAARERRERNEGHKPRLSGMEVAQR